MYSDLEYSVISSFHPNICCPFSVHKHLNNSLACKVNAIAKPKGSYILFICDSIIGFKSITGKTFEICFSRELCPVFNLFFQRKNFNVTVTCNKLLSQDLYIPSTCMASKVVDELNVILTLQTFFLHWMG